MAKRLEDYKTEAEALGINTESLTTIATLKEAIKLKKAEDTEASPEAKQVSLDEAIAEQEAILADLKAKKKLEELEAKRVAKLEEAKNDKRPTYTADNKLVYRFKKDAPKTLNIDGAPKKLEAIIKDKELMAELVSGRNNYLEPVN